MSEVLGFAGGFAHEQDGGSGSNGVSNAIKLPGGMWPLLEASESKDSGAKKRERQVIQYAARPCGSMPATMATVAREPRFGQGPGPQK